LAGAFIARDRCSTGQQPAQRASRAMPAPAGRIRELAAADRSGSVIGSG
jgi:hypothetical protein